MDPTRIAGTTVPAGPVVTAGRTEIPPRLQTALADAGWRHPTDRVFRTRVPVPGGRARVVLLAAWGQGCLALLTPVGVARGGDLPDLGALLAGYVLHPVGDVLMLLRLVPAGPPHPGPAEVTGQARLLAARGTAVAAALAG